MDRQKWKFSTTSPSSRIEKVPSGTFGIYRYKNNNEVVYIGMGDIRKRLSSPERKDWEFDNVEYSKVENEGKRKEWETYWIDRFSEENGKRLPVYNKIGGISEE
jgi:hypothetical protein